MALISGALPLCSPCFPYNPDPFSSLPSLDNDGEGVGSDGGVSMQTCMSLMCLDTLTRQSQSSSFLHNSITEYWDTIVNYQQLHECKDFKEEKRVNYGLGSYAQIQARKKQWIQEKAARRGKETSRLPIFLCVSPEFSWLLLYFSQILWNIFIPLQSTSLSWLLASMTCY